MCTRLVLYLLYVENDLLSDKQPLVSVCVCVCVFTSCSVNNVSV